MVYQTYDGEIVSEVIVDDTESSEEILFPSEEGTEVLAPISDPELSTEIVEYILVHPYSEEASSASEQIDYSSLLSCILIFVVGIFAFLFLTRFKR